MIFHVHVLIAPRRDMVDPAGDAVCTSLHGLGWTSVRSARLGKVVALTIEAADRDEAAAQAAAMAQALLAHPVTEDWTLQWQASP